MKICSKCKSSKTSDSYHKNKGRQDGLSDVCKLCRVEICKLRYEANKDILKKKNNDFYHKNKEAIRASQKRLDTPEKRQKRNARKREYNHSDHAKKLAKIWYQEQMKNNLEFRVKKNLRTRLGSLVRQYRIKKVVSAVESLSIDVVEFMRHIESLWKDGMNWDNYGRGENTWNFDHRIPLSYFNLEDVVSAKMANHYINIEPMWSLDNFKKNDSLPENYQDILEQIRKSLEQI